MTILLFVACLVFSIVLAALSLRQLELRRDA
jgi:hypothetical protein